MEIRKANKFKDYNGVWDIFSAVIKTGDTYTFEPDTPKEDLEKYWFSDYMKTFVAAEGNVIFGTYIIKANQDGLGNHIANCSYMVNPNYHNKGTGKLLCKHSIEFAKQNGFLGIQFNLVVSTNTAAVKLWQKFGFEIIGTTPNGFRHQSLGLVDTYIMYRSL